MTRDEIIKLAREAGMPPVEITSDKPVLYPAPDAIERFAALVIAADRKSLEEKLLKLRNTVAARSDYIQGRWDLIGEFQDILRSKE